MTKPDSLRDKSQICEMTDKIHRHEKLTAVEDLGIALRWQCECGWWTCSIREKGEKLGDIIFPFGQHKIVRPVLLPGEFFLQNRVNQKER